MKETEPSMIDRTLNVWQPRTGRQLSHEDAGQMVENVGGFFRLLLEWDQAEREPESDDRKPDGADATGLENTPGITRTPPRWCNCWKAKAWTRLLLSA